MGTRWITALAAGLVSAALLAVTPAKAQTELTLWSHWASERPKRDFVEDAIRRFEAANPGIKIKTSWYEKDALYAALKTVLRAGQGPDLFYAEPDQTEYMENGLLLELSGLDWGAIEPWAKEAWTYKGKAYGMPLEASTVELYYNRKLVADLGIQVPQSDQLPADAFVDLVKRAKARGIVPMSLGIGDRSFPGAYLVQEALLKRLGTEAYGQLLHGKLSWTDQRVVEALRWVRGLVDAGLLPTTFTSLKLGEAHTFFYANPGAVMYLNGSWYTSRAFNTPDRGGQPEGFPLGIMKYPAVPDAACPECRTLSVQGSYVVNAETKHGKEATAFLNSMANSAAGNRWLEEVLVQTGVKSDPSTINGKYADYFKMLAKANEGAVYFFGSPQQVLQGKIREVFTQVVNNALPAGTITVDEAVRQLAAASK